MNTVNSMDEQFINKLTQIIEDNLHNENFGAAELATQLGMSRVTLYRKVKSVIKKSVSEFIRETRLQRAFEMLKRKEGTVAEISYRVGFNSPPYFNKCFHNYYNLTPGDVLKGILPESESIKKDKKASKERFSYFEIYYVLVAVIFVIAGYFIYHLAFDNKSHDKIVIAIPPFTDNDTISNNAELKVLRTELLGKLSLVTELNIIPPDLTENEGYLELSGVEIGNKLKADYVCLGNRLESGGTSKIYLVLIDVKNNKIVWQRDFEENKQDIWELCSEYVAGLADEFKTPLSPAVEEAIRKKPSENPAALQSYQNGLHELEKDYFYRDTQVAKRFFELAIKHDSAMSEAYAALAHIYYNLLAYEEHGNQELKKNYLDSALLMADKAIKYDNENAKVYGLLAGYYYQAGNWEKSQEYAKLGEKYSIHNSGYYAGKVFWYNQTYEHYKVIENGIKYLQLLPDISLPHRKTMEVLWSNLVLMGFPEEALRYIKLNIEQIPDTQIARVSYYTYMGWHECFSGNFEEAKKYFKKKQDMQPGNLYIYSELTFTALCDRSFPEAFEYVQKTNEIRKIRGDTIPQPDYNFGLAYLEAGQKDKAMFQIQPGIDDLLENIQNNLPSRFTDYMVMAYLYSALNEKEKALSCLNEIKKAKSNFGFLMFGLTYYYSFDRYRDTPEFREVYDFVEKQYNKEHNRIKELLEKEALPET